MTGIALQDVLPQRSLPINTAVGSLNQYRAAPRHRITGSVQARSPRLHGLMIDHPPGIDIEQRFTGEPAAFFFLVQPSGQGLFNDPVFERSKRSAISSTRSASSTGTCAVTERFFVETAMIHCPYQLIVINHLLS